MADDDLSRELDKVFAEPPERRAAGELIDLRRLLAVAAQVPEAFDMAVLMPRALRAVAAVEAVLKLADEAKPALSFPPSDCTNACAGRPCDCSGKSRATGWDLDPAEVRGAITRELTGQEH